MQINAAKSALHRVGQVVLEGHIQHCVRDGIEHGDAEKTIQNFTKAVERFANMAWRISYISSNRWTQIHYVFALFFCIKKAPA